MRSVKLAIHFWNWTAGGKAVCSSMDLISTDTGKSDRKDVYIYQHRLKPGKNEIIIFEAEGKATGMIDLKDKPDIG